VIDLERRVVDPKARVKHLLEFAADRVAVVAGVYEDVS
jgi:hypothetical protein